MRDRKNITRIFFIISIFIFVMCNLSYADPAPDPKVYSLEMNDSYGNKFYFKYSESFGNLHYYSGWLYHGGINYLTTFTFHVDTKALSLFAAYPKDGFIFYNLRTLDPNIFDGTEARLGENGLPYYYGDVRVDIVTGTIKDLDGGK
jgi:hypothetical protein